MLMKMDVHGIEKQFLMLLKMVITVQCYMLLKVNVIMKNLKY